MNFFRTTLAALLLGLLTAVAAAQSAPVTTVEGIAEYRLANGLQVLLVPDDSKPTTTVNVTYRVGSRHENYGETGMAHLLEPCINGDVSARGRFTSHADEDVVMRRLASN
jgi:hypothetical protein